MKKTSYTRKELLIFGLLMGLLLAVVGAWGIWREDFLWSNTRMVLVGLGGLFILAGSAQPKSLTPTLDLWMELTGFIGHTISLVLLTLLYFLVVFPIGGIRQIFGADPMGSIKAPEGQGYWRPPEQDKRGSESFEQQF